MGEPGTLEPRNCNACGARRMTNDQRHTFLCHPCETVRKQAAELDRLRAKLAGVREEVDGLPQPFADGLRATLDDDSKPDDNRVRRAVAVIHAIEREIMVLDRLTSDVSRTRRSTLVDVATALREAVRPTVRGERRIDRLEAALRVVEATALNRDNG